LYPSLEGSASMFNGEITSRMEWLKNYQKRKEKASPVRE
jgi:hypothetical protein